MEMLLMGLCVGIFGLAVVAAAFGAATRSASSDSAAKSDLPLDKPMASAQLASSQAPVPPQRIPIEALLLQIENHIRSEQAAAESFIEFPTHALLHSKTTSTFIN
ncbi:MAG: hypothetical protein WCA89_13170 [Terracidiphilus sp.]